MMSRVDHIRVVMLGECGKDGAMSACWLPPSDWTAISSTSTELNDRVAISAAESVKPRDLTDNLGTCSI